MGHRALLVHTDQYEAPQFQDLGGPQQDVDDLENTLSEHCGFRVERYEALSHGPTRQSVFQFIADSESAETVLIYFSGHGLVPPGDNRLHLACTDTRPGSMIKHTSVAAGDIRRELARLSARTILFLDCCNAGAVNPEDGRGPGDLLDQEVEPLGGDETHVVIAAASKFDVAFEADFSRQVADQDLSDSSDSGIRKTAVFTKFFIDGLKSGQADQDNDGHITVHEAFEWARQRTERHAETKGRRQKPRYSGSSVSKLVLWKHPDLSHFKPTTIGLLRSNDVDDRHHGYKKLAKSLNDDSPKAAAATRLLTEHEDDLPTELRDLLESATKGSDSISSTPERPRQPAEDELSATQDDTAPKEAHADQPIPGKTYSGQVINITRSVAYVGILPGHEGLLHYSTLGAKHGEIDQMLTLGAQIQVTVEDINSNGEVSLILAGHSPDTDTSASTDQADEAQDPGGAAVAARAHAAEELLDNGIAFGAAGNSTAAIASYDQLINTYSSDTETATRTHVATALLYKGFTLNKAGDPTGESDTYDNLIDTYRRDTEPAIREQVAKALLYKGLALNKTGDQLEAISKYDKLIETYGRDTEAPIRLHVARALLNKGIAFGAAGNSNMAIASYDQLIASHDGNSEPAMREQLATALLYKGFTLNQTGDPTGEITAYDQLIDAYGNDTEPAIREQVAKALLYKALTLSKTSGSAEAIKVYEKLIQTYGNDTRLAIREQVAKALLNKAVALGATGDHTAEIAAYDLLIYSYGEDSSSVIAERVDIARSAKERAEPFRNL